MGFFKAPSMPAVLPAPAAPVATDPTLTPAAQAAQAAQMQGRTSTIVNSGGGAGLQSLGSTSKLLLGQ